MMMMTTRVMRPGCGRGLTPANAAPPRTGEDEGCARAGLHISGKGSRWQGCHQQHASCNDPASSHDVRPQLIPHETAIIPRNPVAKAGRALLVI
jgi:hypothetical protein